MSIINPHGKEIVSITTDYCGRPLTLEVNRVGFRSTASVLVRYGDTVVLGTAQVGSRPVQLDYFPLSIDYEEKFYAAGKISGSRFIKREGRPSDEAILIGRLIDRPIRPLFPKGYRQEVQVVASVLSMDPSFRPDSVAMIAASAAPMLTGTPFDGPVAGVRVGRVNGEFKAFLTAEEREQSDLDIVVAGIETGVTMVEAGANEVSEEVIGEALEWAFKAYQPAIALQRELAAKVQPVAQEYELILPNEEVQSEVDAWISDKLGQKLRAPYPERNEMVNELRWSFHEAFGEKLGEDYTKELRDEYDEAFTMALHKDVRRGIVEEQTRPDGRKLDEVRVLSSEVGVLPRTHGSSIFTRGVTQAMNIVALAPLSYSQLVDTMEFNEIERRYMHHYNAPGYTVGEPRRLGSPGRREIGHGYLAQRALEAVLPTEEEFPYAIRSVTEIMSQNGSTSMAATCSSCLALMDAGDLFGEMSMLDDGPRSALARALEPSTEFAIPFDPVVKAFRSDPALLWGVTRLLAHRLRVMDEALADSVFLDVTGRTAKRLLELSEGADEFLLPITQEELAGMVGASRERVNKAIASFIRLGYIDQHERHYTILKRDAMELRAR